jgi:hypothetical protein
LDFLRNPQSCAPFPPSSFSLSILPSFFPFLSHYIFLLFHPSLLSSIPSRNAASNYALHSSLRQHPFIQIIPGSTAYTQFHLPTICYLSIFPLHFSLSSYYIPPFYLPTTCYHSIFQSFHLLLYLTNPFHLPTASPPSTYSYSILPSSHFIYISSFSTYSKLLIHPCPPSSHGLHLALPPSYSLLLCQVPP